MLPQHLRKSKYSGVQVSELQQLRELEAENQWLKRTDADLALENPVIKNVCGRLKTGVISLMAAISAIVEMLVFSESCLYLGFDDAKRLD